MNSNMDMHTDPMGTITTRRSFTALLLVLAFASNSCMRMRDNGLLEDDSQIQTSEFSPAQTPSVKVNDPVQTNVSERNWVGAYAEYVAGLHREVDSCKKLVKEKEVQPGFTFGKRKVRLKQWCVETGQAILDYAKQADSFKKLYALLLKNMEWYRVGSKQNPNPMKITGYYFPTVEASLNPDSLYRYPIYQKPDDLVYVNVNGKKVWRKKNADGEYELYHDRHAIDHDGVLKGRGFEIAYAKDLLSVANLQVEGSGQLLIEAPQGFSKKLIVNYAAQNGRSYVALRRILKEKGVEEKYLTQQGQKQYFTEHPEELENVLNQNPSYVFFKESEMGPLGATGTILTASHSIAIDRKFNPLSAFGIMKSKRAVFNNKDELLGFEDFVTFIITQDVGGAINGTDRIDYYFGEDHYAELAAGVMNQEGELTYMLAPAKSSKFFDFLWF